MSAQLKVLKWLIDNPGWRYPTEIARESRTNAELVYLRCDGLMELGFVEQRHDPDYEPPPGYSPRLQYRTTLTQGKKGDEQ